MKFLKSITKRFIFKNILGLIIILCLFVFIHIAKFFWYPATVVAYPLHTAIRHDVRIFSHTLPYLFIFNNQCRAYLTGRGGPNPLQVAVSKDDYEIVGLLWKLGSDPTGCSTHVFKYAQNLEMMNYLLDRGISPNSREGYRDYPVIYSFSGCLEENQKEPNPKLELLLNKGANPNALANFHESYKPSALYKAAEDNCVGNVKLLLEKGADPLHITYKERGRTILDHIKDKDIYPWSSDRYEFSDELVSLLENAENKARRD